MVATAAPDSSPLTTGVVATVAPDSPPLTTGVVATAAPDSPPLTTGVVPTAAPDSPPLVSSEYHAAEDVHGDMDKGRNVPCVGAAVNVNHLLGILWLVC